MRPGVQEVFAGANAMNNIGLECARSQLGIFEIRAAAGSASCWQSSAACPAWWGGESPPPPWGKESTALSASSLLGELPSNGSPGLMLPGVPHARRALHSPNTVLRLRGSGRSEARLCVHIVPREKGSGRSRDRNPCSATN